MNSRFVWGPSDFEVLPKTHPLARLGLSRQSRFVWGPSEIEVLPPAHLLAMKYGAAPGDNINEDLLDKLVSHQIGLTRLQRTMIDELTVILDSNDSLLLAAIADRAKQDGTLGRIDTVLRAVAGVNDKTFRDIEKALTDRLVKLAKYEQEYQQTALTRLLPIEWDFGRAASAALEEGVTDVPFQGALLSEWIEGMRVGRFNRIRAAIRAGSTAKDSVNSIIKAIRGTKAANYQDGVLAVSRRSAASVTRTAANHAANNARELFYEANSDLIGSGMWVSVLDDRTTDICEGLDGSIFGIGEGPRPPAHIGCRSAFVALIKAIKDLGFDPGDLPDDVVEYMNGEVPAKLTYSGWLKRQPPHVQDGLLGTVHAAMFRHGTMKVGKFIDHTGLRYTIDQLRQIDTSQFKPAKKRNTRMVARAAVESLVIKKNFGWSPDTPDKRDLLYALEHPKSIGLPAKASLRKLLCPIFDQGDLGSCTANALIPPVMYLHGPNTPMLSRLQLYYLERQIEDSVKSDSGAEIRDGIKVLAKIGVCTEAEWPYKIKKFKVKPPLPPDDQDYRISKYSRLKTHDDFMKCIASKFPFVGGFTVYSSFQDDQVAKTGILLMPDFNSEKQIGGHAVCIVGYDTDFHSNPVFLRSGLPAVAVPSFMYEVRNSYGTDWGDAGHFWIPGDYLEDRDLADDFWTIRKLGPGLNPDMPQDSTVNQVGFNPFHDEHGKFATGPIKAFLAGPAKDIVHTVGSKLNDNKRELLAAAITFSLYHVAGADFPADVEEAIHAQVVNFAENAQVSVGIAKDYMSRAVAAMIALRTERNAKKLKVARDEVLEALTGLQTILDNMDVGKLGFNPNHDEKGRFATSEFTDAEFDKAIKGVSAHFTMDEDIPNYVKLSVGERNIIHDYTGPSYLGINNSLRRQTLTPEQQDYVEKLNSALGRMPNYEGTTDRVGSNNPDVLKVYQDAVGKTIEERAFLSTKRSDSSFDPGHRPLVNFTIQGKTGKDIARIAFNPEEREVLFRSGTRFKVISVKKAKDGKYDTVLREV